MAKLLDHSIGLVDIDYSKPLKEVFKEEEQVLEVAREYWRKENKGDLVGEAIQWPRGDGAAMYMVVKQKPLTLAHVAIGDAWQVEPALIRGTTLADVRQMVKNSRAMKELFGSAA